ncbi:UNKNOWN [Stylonychia lemnae]|uniref:Transmembrane protein n=1 Tax=Stylonychia lemnae TaxID=5949 RepID=A0A077ZSW0_STYLE|nr:UNKNOWN [Stylonychia lemnae]|eukprot:CDW72639.1 UNKNOWN [Stylonychia lemnae]
MFVDRYMVFQVYEQKLLQNHTLHSKYNVQLDKSIVNNICHDMVILNNERKDVVMFCRSKQPIVDQKTKQFIDYDFKYQMVYVTKFYEPNQRSIIYLQYIQERIILEDDIIGIKYLDEPINGKNANEISYFIGVTLLNNQRKLVVFFTNNSRAYELENRKINFREYNQSDLMRIQYYIDLPEEYESVPFIDVSVLKFKVSILAVVFEQTLLLCSYDKRLLDPFFVRSENDATSIPPQIMELNTDDQQNIIVTKIYLNPGDKQTNIGKSNIAVNRNFIIHMMKDVSTDKHFLRIYDRNSQRFDLSKQKYQVNYLFIQDTFILRNEQQITQLSIDQWLLKLTGTNKNLIEKYASSLFECNLNVSNSQSQLVVYFNLSFVDDKFMTVYSRDLGNPNIPKEIDIFYNCGDKYFQFITTDYFIGPNFAVEYYQHDENCDDGSCYFDLQNQEFKLLFHSQLEHDTCRNSKIFPPYNYDAKSSQNNVLICFDVYDYSVRSLVQDTKSQQFRETNKIYSRNTNYLFHSYDVNDRRMFYIHTYYFIKSITYAKVQFYDIRDSIIYRGEIPVQISDIYPNDEEELIFSYDEDFNRGVIIFHNLRNDSRTLLVYEVLFPDSINFTSSSLFEVAHLKIDPYFKKQYTYKAIVCDNLVITAQNDSSISLFQITGNGKTSKMSYIRTRVISNESGEIIRDIELQDQKYLIIYIHSNIVRIFEVLSLTGDIIYKGQLPIYPQYQSFSFFVEFPYVYRIHKSYDQGFLAIMLEKRETDNTLTNKVFVYCITCEALHDSLFVISNPQQNISEGTIFQIALIKTQNSFNLFTIVIDKIFIHQADIFNSIQVTKNEENARGLIQNCSVLSDYNQDSSNITSKTSSNQIARLKVSARSLFDEGATSQGQVIINIYSQNQGLVITPTQKLIQSDRITDITFSNQLENKVSVQDYLGGASMRILYNCSYFDSDMNVQSCNNQVKDLYSSKAYTFYIEFVTSNRQVIFSSMLGRYIFMLDNRQLWYLLQFPGGRSYEFDSVNDSPLEILEIGSLNQNFSCEIGSDGGYFSFFSFNTDDEGHSYLAFYQCQKQQFKYLGISIIKVYNKPTSNGEYIKIERFLDQFRFPFTIIDVDRAHHQDIVDGQTSYQFILAISCSVANSFSNVVYILNFQMDLENKTVTLDNQNWIGSATEGRDSFRVTKLIQIPRSDMLIVVDQDTGAYIYDLKTQKSIFSIEIEKLDDFIKQSLDDYDQVLVYSALGEWPSTIHLLTNFGIFIYSFNVDLTNRTQIYQENDQVNLKIVKQSTIRRNFNQQLSNDVVFNQFAYSFLAQLKLSKDQYDIYLITVSLYSGQTSRLIDIQKIGTNLHCSQLIQDKSLTDQKEDIIAVSFVCNTQLYVYKITTRPTLEINFKDVDDGLIMHQIQKFNLTINATSSIYMSSDQVTIIFRYIVNAEDSRYLIYFAGFGILGFLSVLLIILIRCFHKQHHKTQSQYEKRYEKPSFSYIARPVTIINGKEVNLKKNVDDSFELIETQDFPVESYYQKTNSTDQQYITNSSIIPQQSIQDRFKNVSNDNELYDYNNMQLNDKQQHIDRLQKMRAQFNINQSFLKSTFSTNFQDDASSNAQDVNSQEQRPSIVRGSMITERKYSKSLRYRKYKARI